ncbi:hypothetical protein ACQP00_13930 [Dactylosporangium sp. CS-047395]|uniref:hypothetical protein n=1 Tax=Dactylosporangium sp. CS-047395 TaxID=3239936 RepID=UPI003D8BCCB1
MTATVLADVVDIREGLPPRRRVAVSIDEWWRRHRRSLLVLAPILAAVAAAHLFGASGARYVDDPGTYLSQAWALRYEGSLSPYSYFYDHAPAGWMQIALWAALTNGFDRYDSALAFGVECMLLAKLASTVLIFALARRLGFPRVAGAATALLFGLCPLEVVYGRWTFLDNLVVPWLLAALVLAASPRRSILAATGATLCFAMATLTKETALVLLPAFAWAVWQNLDPRNRAQVLAVAACSGALLMSLYPLFALYKGEFFAGPGHNSLLGTAHWQLVDRPSSGSLLDRDSAGRALLTSWLGYDRILLVLGAVAAAPALLIRPLRPVVAMHAIQWFVLIRGGYVPFMHVINLVPGSALLTVGVLVAVGGRTAAPSWRRLVALGAGAALAGTAAIAWTGPLLQAAEAGRPALRSAELWVADNVPRDAQLVVHDAIWTDLVHHYGFDPRPIIVYKLDTDPAVQRATRRVDYLVLPNWYYETQGADKYPTVMEARRHAIVVAEFGGGSDGVRIYRVSRFWQPTWSGR